MRRYIAALEESAVLTRDVGRAFCGVGTASFVEERFGGVYWTSLGEVVGEQYFRKDEGIRKMLGSCFRDAMLWNTLEFQI